jgi:hypothetical protein
MRVSTLNDYRREFMCAQIEIDIHENEKIWIKKLK